MHVALLEDVLALLEDALQKGLGCVDILLDYSSSWRNTPHCSSSLGWLQNTGEVQVVILLLCMIITFLIYVWGDRKDVSKYPQFT